MRKIHPSLQSQGYDSFKDLLSRPSNIITVGPSNCDYTSPIDAANVAQSGDLIFVYPGTYDIGANSIILKNGVNWHFLPSVFITSSSNNGTFYDNNTAVDVNFEGDPIIANSASSYSINLQDSNSKVRGYKFYFDLQILGITDTQFAYTTYNTNIPQADLSALSVIRADSNDFFLNFPRALCGDSQSFDNRSDHYMVYDTTNNESVFLYCTSSTTGFRILIRTLSNAKPTSNPTIGNLSVRYELWPEGDNYTVADVPFP